AFVRLRIAPPDEFDNTPASVFAPVFVPVSVSVRGAVPKLSVSAPAAVGVLLSVMLLAAGLIAMIVVPAGMFVPVTVMPRTRSVTPAAKVAFGVLGLSVVARGVASDATTLPVFAKLIAPAPDESSPPPVGVTVNNRSVLPPAPAYWNVPPVRTRFAAAL